MLFTSGSFAVFFAIVAVLYFCAQRLQEKQTSSQNTLGQIVLLVGSLVFYALNGLIFLPLILLIGGIAYGAGRYCAVHKNKAVFFCLLAMLVLPLLCFKYTPPVICIDSFQRLPLTCFFRWGFRFIPFRR